MRAVRYDAVGSVPRVVSVPEPVPSPDGVVVRVTATGVCRSDWHAWQGHEPVPLPMIPGHEFVGVIAAVGERVRTCAVGDRVTVPFIVACGACSYCLSGDGQVCPSQTQPGFTHDGSFAEFVAVSPADFNVVHVPPGIADAVAASLGCRFATSYRALVAHGEVGSGQWVAVHGSGGVGLSALLIARALGGRGIVTDLSAAALELASSLGADAVVNVAGLSPVEIGSTLADITGSGAHVSLDALGSPASAEASVRSLRRRGRHLQVGLLLKEQSTPPLPMDLVVAHELSIHGCHGMAAVDYPGLLDLVTSGGLDPSPLISRVVSLDDVPAALMALSQPSGQPGITIATP